MRDFRKLQKERAERRAFWRGAEAMRAAAIRIFSGAGSAEFNGRAVAELLKTCDPRVST
jgi:hypothetical protein